jgi:ribonucleotide monophosphatase NagD (HAD superfamily)
VHVLEPIGELQLVLDPEHRRCHDGLAARARRRQKIFVIGEAPLTSALLAAGLTLTEDAREVDIVVASYDRTFEYRKCRSRSTPWRSIAGRSW